MNNVFRRKVYEVTHRIPKGKVATYSQVASLAGNKRAARAVGVYLRHNNDRLFVPCHRVVGSNGTLTGYSFGEGIRSKKDLLMKEGVIFIREKVNLIKSQWNGKV